MERKLTKIVFNADDLTCLRYLIPIARFIRDYRSAKIEFAINRFGNKYNRMNITANENRFLKIMKRYDFSFFDIADRSKICCDVLFSVENLAYLDNKYSCGKHFSIQHGYDFIHLGKLCKSTYIFHDPIFANYSEFVNDFVISPIPVTFWDYCDDEILVDLNKVFILAPESGHLCELEKVVKYFESAGKSCVVKQRRKSQGISTAICKNVVYDDLWYPSESILTPTKSGIVVGFNSSAYVDFLGARKKYINLNVGNESCRFYLDQYYFPTDKDYFFQVDSVDELIASDCKKYESDLILSYESCKVIKFLEHILD